MTGMLDGNIAIVTGASSGIGAAIAQVALRVTVKSIDGTPISNASIFEAGNEKALGQTNEEGFFLAQVSSVGSAWPSMNSRLIE